MKLTVNNLGAVSHAEIDLDKRLLIFTGENNTGKTYVTTVIHSLFDIKEIAWNAFNEKGETIALIHNDLDDDSHDFSNNNTIVGTYQMSFDIIHQQKLFYDNIAKMLLENISQVFATSSNTTTA